MLSALLLTACNNDTDTEQIPTGDNNVTEVDGSEEDTSGLPPMTTEEITLTFGSNTATPLLLRQIEGFMSAHPNITVEFVEIPGGNEGLFNAVAAGELPDVFWYNPTIDLGIENMWFRDISEYTDVDPEFALIPDSLKNVGTFGDVRLIAPSNAFPFVAYLDRTLFERYNVELPTADWTFDEFVGLIQDMTIPADNIFGIHFREAGMATLYNFLNTPSLGTYGWNGSDFDMDIWLSSRATAIELNNLGTSAPWQPELRLEVFGDDEIDPTHTGQVAMVTVPFWYQEYLDLDGEFAERGIDWTMLPMPVNPGVGNQLAFVDNRGISAITEHPREAYELLKWMGFGEDGWLYQISIFGEYSEEMDREITPFDAGVPVTTNDRVWEAYTEAFPQTEEWQNFLANIRNLVGMHPSRFLPGFQAFMDWMEEQEIMAQIDEGTATDVDLAPYILENALRFVNEAHERVIEMYGR